MFMDEQTELNNIRNAYAEKTMVIAFHPDQNAPSKLDVFVCHEVFPVTTNTNTGIRRFIIDAYSIACNPIKLARMAHIDLKPIPNNKYDIFVTLDLIDGSYITQLDMSHVTIMSADEYFKLNPVFKTEYDRTIASYASFGKLSSLPPYVTRTMNDDNAIDKNAIDKNAIDKLFDDVGVKFVDEDPWDKCDKLPDFITTRTVHEFNTELLKPGLAVEITFNDVVSSLWGAFTPGQTLIGILADVSPSAISVVYVPAMNMAYGKSGVMTTFFPYHNINIRILQ
jgi:hypothetical protein